MFSCYDQPLPAKKHNVVSLGCRECGPKDGYKMWRVDRAYYLKFDNFKVVQVENETDDAVDDLISEVIEDVIPKGRTKEENEIIERAMALLGDAFPSGFSGGLDEPKKRGRGRPKGSKNKKR